jgi:hypothetical protein
MGQRLKAANNVLYCFNLLPAESAGRVPGFIVGLRSLCCRFQGSSYLLAAASIILEVGGDEFHLLGEGILVTESCDSVSGK